MSQRYSAEGGMVEVLTFEMNLEYEKDLLENPIGPDDDPTDTLDELTVTIKITVKDSLHLASLRLMAEEKQRIVIATS